MVNTIKKLEHEIRCYKDGLITDDELVNKLIDILVTEYISKEAGS